MPLFGPPNVERLKAKGDVKGLIKALDYEKDPSVRQAAAKALGEIGDARAVEPLIAVLKDKAVPVRMTAAGALGELGDARAMEPLIVALKNDNAAAARALGELGDARAVEPLIAALKDGDKYVRQAAAGALGELGDARAVEPLIAALKNGNAVAAGALEQLGWQPDRSEAGAAYWVARRQWDKCAEIGAPAVELLIAALKDRNLAVAAVLGEIGDARAVEPLIAALGGTDKYMRSAAAGALVEIGAPAVEPLIPVLKHRQWDVREAATRVLGKIGDRRAVEPLIAVLKDEAVLMRMTAAGALGEIGDPRGVGPLTAALGDENHDVREAAAGALDKLDWQPDRSETGAAYWIAKRQWDRCVEIGAPAVKSLIAALKNVPGDEHVRSAAVGALAKIGAPAVEPLIAALGDEKWYVRTAGAEALGGIGDARAVEPLIAALEGENYYVRGAAAGALERLGWQPDQSEAGAAYWIAKRQWDRCVEIGARAVEPLIADLKNGNLAVAAVLGEIGDARAVEPLIAALYDEGGSMRRAAAEALIVLYRSEKLDAQAKHSILARQSTMTYPHQDYTPSSDCTDHHDQGIGVTF